jgi:hypothetical protein
MAPRRTRRERKARADLTGWILIAAIVIVLGAVGLVWSDQRKANPKLDAATLCPESGPASVTVVLVDVTDELSRPQAQDFQNQFERLRAETPRHGLLEVFLVRELDQGLLAPVVSLCNPGRGADVNEFLGNPQRVEARWRQGFEAPLDEAFKLVATASSAVRSPVLEAIQSVALTALASADRVDVPRRLVVVSDLMQHTQTLSFYRGLPDPGALIENPAFQQVRTDLHDVTVELWMLHRPGLLAEQQGGLARLWERLIREQGGQVVRIYNVSG